jgi:ABC-type transporter Mla maintaining outer membrane lipid asymmetry ATPase subunit MlaF
MDNPGVNPNIPVVEMTGLSVGSREDPDLPVLENVNWAVMAGEYWVVGGLHGSGKTDLLFTTAGLTPPLKGVCRFFGREMPARGDQLLAERLRVGLVFDGGRLFPHLTLAENIALPLRYHRDRAGGDLEKSVKTILDLTGLSAQAGRRPDKMGRAWRKRGGLARALVLRPEVLLLDNPLGGLDSPHAQWWLDTLDQLSAGRGFFEGRAMTLVVAGEDLRPWRNRAANLAVLQKRQFWPLGHHPQLGRLNDPLVKELLAEPSCAK